MTNCNHLIINENAGEDAHVSLAGYRSGQSLFEVIFALGIASIVLVAIVALSSSSVRNSTYSKNSIEATQLAQQATEWLRGQRDKCWDTQTTPSCTGFVTRSNASGITWCIPDLTTWPASSGPCTASQQVTGTIFTRSVVLTSRDLDGNTVTDAVDADVIVSWTDPQGTHDSKNHARFTDWRR